MSDYPRYTVNSIAYPSPRPSWVLPFNISTPTAATEIAAVEAGTQRVCRLMRLVIWQVGAQTTGGNVAFSWISYTTAGSGSTVTPARLGNNGQVADSITFSGICRSGNTGASLGGGTTNTIVTEWPWIPATTVAAFGPLILDLGGQGMCYELPTVIPGVGLTLRHAGCAGATGSTQGYLVFTEDPS